MVEIDTIERDRDIKALFAQLYDEIHKVIIGVDEVIEHILIALFSNGHVLLESVPGMGKTLLSKSIASTLECEFKRVQGTPDLKTTDIIGEVYYDKETGEQKIIKGPIFTNILLMDELNRAPPKTQSALLEAMEERMVTIGDKTYSLPQPFIVLATQNPLEQKGVFPLPEAQKDRFLFKSVIEYPTLEEEMMIAKSKLYEEKLHPVFNPAEILIIQKDIKESVIMPDSILEYIVKIVQATRNRREVRAGAGPRATIAFMMATKTRAFLNGRNEVNVTDVRKLAHPILRHRIVVSPEYAEMGTTPDYVINKILDSVESPQY
ncbi:MAG: hypothetical protein DRO94_04365 [Candidatus Altiarchaeales archaeon]|nr:MAG: hypothetical protein DRO94_04365 [Candidatus Altiarchaeales archaeon]